MNIPELNMLMERTKLLLIEHESEHKTFCYASALYALNLYNKALINYLPNQSTNFRLSTESGDNSQ